MVLTAARYYYVERGRTAKRPRVQKGNEECKSR
jgi:hypothetical protein